jgi:integrase
LAVRQQLIEVKGKFLGFGPPKTAAGRRMIDLPAFLCRLLTEQLERAQPGPDGLVFVNTRGQSPHQSSFHSQTWSKARVAIDRPDLRWYDLRHTAAALAIAQGAHSKLLQERMGHSSIKVTLDTYGHLLPTLGVQVADGLDLAFERATATANAGTPVTELGPQKSHNGRGKDPKTGPTAVNAGQHRSAEIAR